MRRSHRTVYPVNVEAAWLHHRFVRTHPFQDGNGRVSRLLMVWAYLKRSLPPPIIDALRKPDYIVALEAADAGNLKAFSDYLAVLAMASMIGATNWRNGRSLASSTGPTATEAAPSGDTYLPPLDPLS